MSEHGFAKKVLRGLTREQGLGNMLGKASRLLRETAAAHAELRGCDKVGSGARVIGRLRVENRGRIEIGDGFSVNASYCAVELVSEKGGAIEIGESVVLNFGTMLYARQMVRIGDRSQVGQYSILSDCEVPEVQGAFQEEPKPIIIGKDVWIAGRVTVLPGSTIGDGSVVTAGSIVLGEIPPGVVAGGVPARILRKVNASPAPSEGSPAQAKEKAPPSPPAAAPISAAAEVQPARGGLNLGKVDEGPSVVAEASPFGKVAQSSSASGLILPLERKRDQAWLAGKCTSLGKDAWLRGRPAVSNRGRLIIGSRFRCASTPVASHLVTAPRGLLQIGDDVSFSYGAAIYCEAQIRIGDGTRLGPYAVLADTNFHVVGDLLARPEPRPVEIGRGVKIGARVNILPGATIGDGATVAAGSTVRGAVAPGALVTGVPAKVHRPKECTAESLRALVRRIFELSEAPALSSGLAELTRWDSFGALRLLLAIEHELEVRLDEAEMARVKSIADLVAAVERARDKQAKR
jgi:maltose O-acetyltransferase